ncbi:hypothetical protein O181_057915, partial [Austropuccinia psidii MF-1]|nr:hypothetical protein [Austropuccinia psidii MF-1]
SDNVVRQENIETDSTVTSIVPASTVNSDHISTKNLANSLQPYQEQAITPQAAPRKVIDVIMAEANQLQKDKGQLMTSKLIKDFHNNEFSNSEADHTVLPSNRAENTTRSLNGHLQSQPEGLQQCTAAQRVPDPCRYVEKLHEFLPDSEKVSGPSQHLQVTQWMASIDGKEEDDALNSRIEEKKPSTTQASAKNSPSGHQQQFQHEKAAQS